MGLVLLVGAHSQDPLPSLFQEQVNTMINLGFDLEGSREPVCSVHRVCMLIPQALEKSF